MFSNLFNKNLVALLGLVKPEMNAGEIFEVSESGEERPPPDDLTGSEADVGADSEHRSAECEGALEPTEPEEQAVGLSALSTHFAGQAPLLTELRRSQTVRSKTVRARYSLPTTVVLVPYGNHQSEAVRLGQTTMDFQRSLVIHPVRMEMFQVAYDHSPETNNLFYRREYNQNLSELPVVPECQFGEDEVTLVDYVRFDAATETAFFPAGTLNKYFRDQLFPRSGNLTN
jgi:hypothetical protein